MVLATCQRYLLVQAMYAALETTTNCLETTKAFLALNNFAWQFVHETDSVLQRPRPYSETEKVTWIICWWMALCLKVLRIRDGTHCPSSRHAINVLTSPWKDYALCAWYSIIKQRLHCCCRNKVSSVIWIQKNNVDVHTDYETKCKLNCDVCTEKLKTSRGSASIIRLIVCAWIAGGAIWRLYSITPIMGSTGFWVACYPAPNLFPHIFLIW